MNLLVKAKREGREICNVTPESAGGKFVGDRAVRLAAGETEQLESGSNELCLVVLTGTVDVTVGGETWSTLGERNSVFEPISPAAVYVPPGQSVKIVAARDAEV